MDAFALCTSGKQSGSTADGATQFGANLSPSESKSVCLSVHISGTGWLLQSAWWLKVPRKWRVSSLTARIVEGSASLALLGNKAVIIGRTGCSSNVKKVK